MISVQPRRKSNALPQHPNINSESVNPLGQITEGERLGQSRFDKLKSAYNAIDSNYKRYFDTGAIERIDDLLGQLHEVGSIQRSDLADQDDRNAVAKKVKAVQEANNLALEELGL